MTPPTAPARQPMPAWAVPLITATAAVSGLAGYATAGPLVHGALTALVHAARWVR